MFFFFFTTDNINIFKMKRFFLLWECVISNKLTDLITYRRSSNPKEDRERKKAKKNPVPLQPPLTPKDAAKGPKVHKRSSGETQETSKEAAKSKKDARKQKKSSGKYTEHPPFEKVTGCKHLVYVC